MKLTTKLKDISYTSSNFKTWFGKMEFPEVSDMIPLISKKLPRYMNDNEIFSELKPQEVTLSEVYFTLQSLDKSIWSLFYMKDTEGVLRTVDVYWGGKGWVVLAFSVLDPHEWLAGGQVFSRNFSETEKVSLSSSDTLTLESAIKICKEAGLVVTKIY